MRFVRLHQKNDPEADGDRWYRPACPSVYVATPPFAAGITTTTRPRRRRTETLPIKFARAT